VSDINLNCKNYDDNKQIKKILDSYKNFDEAKLFDEITDSDQEKKENSDNFDSIDPFDSSNSYYRKKLEKIKLIGSSYRTLKNFKTNDTSSSIASSSESFELEIEYEEENKINKSSCSNIILYDDEYYSSEKSEIEDFKTQEVLGKLKSLKKALKNLKQPHINFDNFLKNYDKIIKEEKI
jgi:hypothetical protein